MPAARRAVSLPVSSSPGSIRMVNGERVIRFPVPTKFPVLGRKMVGCPACGEKMPRTTRAMRHHSTSGCGEMVSLPQLYRLIQRERRNSQHGPDYVSVQCLRDALEQLTGSNNWFVGGDMDLLLESMEDMAL